MSLPFLVLFLWVPLNQKIKSKLPGVALKTSLSSAHRLPLDPIRFLSVTILSHFRGVQLFATPCTVALQAPLSWDSPGKNTRVGCHALL